MGNIIISVLLSVIAFFLVKVHNKLEKVEDNTNKLLINDGKKEIQIKQLENRADKIEKKLAI